MIKNVIDYAMKLEGMARNAGCHAAGVIIADQPLDGIVPLYRDSDGNVLTQFEGPVAEKCGLLKMDFLGLRTLTSLTRSIDLERQTRDIRPVKWLDGQPVPAFDEDGRYEVDKIDLTDPRVYKLFQRGETRAVFQFESGGMQDLLMKMVPDRIEDLIAANALYRPGPMELIPTLLRPQARQGAGAAGPPDHGRHPRRDLRNHGVPRAGHADLQPARRDRAEQRLQTDQGDQQEEHGDHRQVQARLPQGNYGEGRLQGQGRGDLRLHPQVRGLRVQ